MKRLSAPDFWPIRRKEKKFIVKPSPGPHSSVSSIPLAVVLRDILKLAENMAEVKQILNSNNVKVNGRIRRSKNYPVGLMDIIEIKDAYYRVLVDKKGLRLFEINKKDAFRLLQVKNKAYAKKAKIQLNLHDGTNILADSTKGDALNTGDVLVIKEGKISEVLPFSKGSLGLVVHGHNIGTLGTIENIIVKQASMQNEVVLNVNNKMLLVPKNYVFIVGKEEQTDAKGVKRYKPLINVHSAIGGTDE